MLVPLEVTAERHTAGWWILLAYPRLYATWLMWAVCVNRVITSSLQPGSTAPAAVEGPKGS
jgi:hypothetical protein